MWKAKKSELERGVRKEICQGGRAGGGKGKIGVSLLPKGSKLDYARAADLGLSFFLCFMEAKHSFRCKIFRFYHMGWKLH